MPPARPWRRPTRHAHLGGAAGAGRLAHPAPRADPSAARLEAICLKALAAEPALRYPGVSELSDDVTRYLEGERVLAHPEGLAERALRFASRYRTPILLVLAYVVMRVVLLLVARV